MRDIAGVNSGSIIHSNQPKQKVINLYEKRGRNAKGQIMFHGMGG